MRKISDFFRNLFTKNNKVSSSTANVERGFHPEILFLINLPYAEYVDYEEI